MAGNRSPGRPNEWEGPELFKRAYRYVVDRVRARGARNIQWMFQTNNYSFPMDTWNFAPAYYPGSDYVDWLGLSVYGQQFNDEPWADFLALVDWPYQEIAQLDPKKPIMIAEWATGEFPNSGDKAKWIREAFAVMRTKLPAGESGSLLARTLAKPRPELQQSAHQFVARSARRLPKAVADPYWLGDLILRPASASKTASRLFRLTRVREARAPVSSSRRGLCARSGDNRRLSPRCLTPGKIPNRRCAKLSRSRGKITMSESAWRDALRVPSSTGSYVNAVPPPQGTASRGHRPIVREGGAAAKRKRIAVQDEVSLRLDKSCIWRRLNLKRS